jgi:hypothetical protein
MKRRMSGATCFSSSGRSSRGAGVRPEALFNGHMLDPPLAGSG